MNHFFTCFSDRLTRSQTFILVIMFLMPFRLDASIINQFHAGAEVTVQQNKDSKVNPDGNMRGENIMIVHDVEAQPGEIITIQIEIINDDPFIGFNLDLICPAGFSYIENSTQLHRKTDHDYGFNPIAHNVFKIIAYSLSNSTFLENEGIIFSFDMEAPDVEGVFNFQISDPVIGNAVMENIITGTINGTVTLQFPDEDPDESTLTLLSNPTDGGSTDGAGIYLEGDEVLLTANANDGYAFINWTDEGGDAISYEPAFTFIMPGEDVSLTANFAINTYTISATSGPNGEITPSGDVVVEHGGSQNFIITPDTGYHIADVLVDGVSVGAVSEYTFVDVETDHSIHAEFAINFYMISVAAIPVEGGTVEGEGNYFHGQQVTVLATPNEGYDFVNWSENGVVVSTDAEYVFNANNALNLVAHFELRTHAVVFDVVNGNGSLTASADGEEIASGDYVLEGKDVLFVATPAIGYRLKEWKVNGVIADGYVDEMFTYEWIDEDITVTVEFELIQYVVTFEVLDGNGTMDAFVSGDPIESGDSFLPGVSVEFVANPAEGYRIAEWRRNGLLLAGYTLPTYTFNNLNQDIHITVAFEAITYALNVSVLPGNSGVVTRHPDKEHYAAGEVISLEAVPEPGYEFKHWLSDSKSVLSTENPYDYTMPAEEVSLTAVFQLSTYVITATSGANGEIAPSGDVVVEHGGSQAFNITPDTGYHIADVLVDGVSVGAVSEYTFTDVENNHSIHAEFAINVYTISVAANPTEGGTVDGAGNFNHGQQAAVTATPNEGYDFVNWTENGIEVSTDAEYVFNANNNRNLLANFELRTCAVVFEVVNGNGSLSASVDGEEIDSGDPVPEGKEVVFVAIPASGYQIKEWQLNGLVLDGHTGETLTIESIQEDITVAVEFELLQYSVTFEVADGEGTLNAFVGGDPIESGESHVFGVSVEFVANPAEGYRIAEWRRNGVLLMGYTLPNYTFNNLNQDIHITVAFEAITYALNVSVLPMNSGVVTRHPEKEHYAAGEVISLQAVPETGYEFKQWLSDSKSVLSTENPYDYTMPAEEVSLTAVFQLSTYVITATSGANGEIAPSGDVVVEHGGSQAFTIMPDAGYHIADVLVDGVSVGAVPEYTFTDVENNHSIHALFEQVTYAITFVITDSETGESIDDAQITFDGMSYDAGDYVIESVPAGLYQYSVQKDGYVPFSEEIEVSDNVNVHVVLQPLAEEIPDYIHIAKDEHVDVYDTGCFYAQIQVQIAGHGYSFTVHDGAEATVAAGESIRMLPGTIIEAGAYFLAYIAPEDPCGRPFAEEMPEPITQDFIVDDEFVDTDDNSLFFKIYPNPTSGEFTVQIERFGADEHLLRIEVYDLMGNKVIGKGLPPETLHTISLDNRQAGIYIVRLIRGDSVAVQRLIKR